MKLRFTNRAVKALFEAHQIDLMHLGGDAMLDAETRLKITQAGFVPEGGSEDVATLCDDMTPGDHIDLLNTAILRDLLPASAREAIAKAAATTKSEAESE